jgi:C4-dicarboxylate transporter, DctM subunit
MENQERLKSIADRIITSLGMLSGILILLPGLFIVYDVAMRYFFNRPTSWVLEFSIYAIVASSFLGVAYVLRQKGHVNVDFVTNHLSGKTKTTLEIFTSLLSMLYIAVLCWEGWKQTVTYYQSGEVSAGVIGVPMYIPQFFIPFGSALLTLQFVRYLGSLCKDLVHSKPGACGPTREMASFRESVIRPTLITGLFVAALIIGLLLLKVSMYLGLLILFAALLMSGAPVAFALGLFGLFGLQFLFGGGPQLAQVNVIAYSTMDNPVTVALPLFVLTSCVLRNGRLGLRIFRFADVMVRHLPGGIGLAAVIFCGLFAAMTGSSVAVAATVSMIALPEMLSRGYSRRMAIGLLAAGGTLGILFPPSLPLMLYGAMTGESVGHLFLATLIPGLVLSAMFCGYVAIAGGRDKNIQRDSRASFREIMAATGHASGGLLTIVLIMGGIYSGVFTPSEAGGVAAIYSIILCCFIYRTLPFQGLKQSLLEAVNVNSMIMLIVIGANITGQIILMSQIPQNALAFVKSMDVPSWVVILSVNIFLILLGGPLEAITILVITLPVLYPLITGLGFSGLWFAVILMINMELALISPPEGLNLFILQNLAKSTAAEVSWGVVPFLIMMGVFLALISLVPGLTTWLPAVVMK